MARPGEGSSAARGMMHASSFDLPHWTYGDGRPIFDRSHGTSLMDRILGTTGHQSLGAGLDSMNHSVNSVARPSSSNSIT